MSREVISKKEFTKQADNLLNRINHYVDLLDKWDEEPWEYEEEIIDSAYDGEFLQISILLSQLEYILRCHTDYLLDIEFYPDLSLR